jgi:hypothetical protein
VFFLSGHFVLLLGGISYLLFPFSSPLLTSSCLSAIHSFATRASLLFSFPTSLYGSFS